MSGFGDIFSGFGGLLGSMEAQPKIKEGEDQFYDQLYDTQGFDPAAYYDQVSRSTDPKTREAQMRALSQLSDLGKSGGLDDQAKAELSQSVNSTNAQARGNRDALMQQYNAKGMGGSGAQLASLLQANQGESNKAAGVGVQAASDARQRALKALGDYGQMAGQVRGQDYGQAMGLANAKERGQVEKLGLLGSARAGVAGQKFADAANDAAWAKGAGQAVGGAADAASSAYGMGGDSGPSQSASYGGLSEVPKQNMNDVDWSKYMDFGG